MATAAVSCYEDRWTIRACGGTWEVWRGIAGLFYARQLRLSQRGGCSPPLVARAKTAEKLPDACAAAVESRARVRAQNRLQSATD